MITRIRVEASGAWAAEVEEQMLAVYRLIRNFVDETASTGEQVIERQQAEPHGAHTAHSGRLLIYLNVASDSKQVEWLKGMNVEVTKPSWTADDAVAVGGTPMAGVGVD